MKPLTGAPLFGMGQERRGTAPAFLGQQTDKPTQGRHQVTVFILQTGEKALPERSPLLENPPDTLQKEGQLLLGGETVPEPIHQPLQFPRAGLF